MKPGSNKTKASRPGYAIIILVSAIAFPAYFLSAYELSPPTAMQWAFIILYSVAAIGFALMAAGIKARNITGKETDNRIMEKKAAIDKALKPYLIIFVTGMLLWVAYTIFTLKNSA